MSRAHRRGTYAGSPISNVASAALAVKLGGGTDKPAFDPAAHNRRKTPVPRSPASKLWQRAAEVGGGAESGANGGAVRHLGFNVVAAIRQLHGVSVQQLKQRLDDRYTRMEEVSVRLFWGFEAVSNYNSCANPAVETGRRSRPATSPRLFENRLPYLGLRCPPWTTLNKQGP